MKRLIFCFANLFALHLCINAQTSVKAGSNGGGTLTVHNKRAQHLPQAFSGTIWTTFSRRLPNGSTRVTTQRTEVIRDPNGNWIRQSYQPTNGFQYDMSAPLIHTATGTTTRSKDTMVQAQIAGEILERHEDLGTKIENGFEAHGQRQTYMLVGSNPLARHTLETWYSPSLNTIAQTESHNSDGSVITSVLTNVRVGGATLVTASSQVKMQMAATQSSALAVSETTLFRGLFSIVAKMERAGEADKTHGISTAEQHLRATIDLSEREWLLLATTALKVDGDTHDTESRIRLLAHQQPDSNTQRKPTTEDVTAALSARAQTRKDLQTRIANEIYKLEQDEGPQATSKIHAYLEGPLAASAQVIHVRREWKVAQ